MEDEGGDDEFLMHCFGITETGKSVCLQIEGFEPFFYVSLGKFWKSQWTSSFIHYLRDNVENPKGI